ncbi:MAG: tetratricopeptide repeat protein [Bacteroidetes bacterium]|nr:tetratricopeptide repeat protein [Bacteroidota bacterium]
MKVDNQLSEAMQYGSVFVNKARKAIHKEGEAVHKLTEAVHKVCLFEEKMKKRHKYQVSSFKFQKKTKINKMVNGKCLMANVNKMVNGKCLMANVNKMVNGKCLMANVVFVFTLSIIHSTLSISQNAKTDSLLSLLKKDKEDTNKVNHLNALAFALYYTNPDSTILLAKQAIQILSSKFQVSSSKFQGKEMGLGTWDLKLGTLLANAYGTAGVGYWVKGDYPKALENHFAALKIDEGLVNTLPHSSPLWGEARRGVATRLGNIGLVYADQADYPKALDYYFRALKMDEELGNKNGIARHLGNIGIVYKEQADYPKALDYYFRRMKLDEESGNKSNMAINLGNIGIVYKEQAECQRSPDSAAYRDRLFTKALDYYFRALKMREELGAKKLIASTLGNIGALYSKTGKFREAEEYLKHSVALSDTLGDLEGVKEVNQNLSQLYDTLAQLSVGNYKLQTTNYKLSFQHYKKYIAARDTINSEENQKKQTRTEMNYEFEKKEAATKAEQEKKDAVAAAEARKQKIILLFVVGGLLLVVAFAAFILRAYTQIKKKNILISEQKKKIEEKQEEILASIRYAARIQKCMMPTEKWIAKEIARLKAKMPK